MIQKMVQFRWTLKKEFVIDQSLPEILNDGNLKEIVYTSHYLRKNPETA